MEGKGFYGRNGMGCSSARHHHRAGARDEGSLYVADHRHFLRSYALREFQCPRSDPHDVRSHGGEGRGKCQHPRLSCHPRHPRRRHHALGRDEGLRRLGGAHDSGQAQCSRDHGAPRHRYFHRRLLQLPDGRHGHAPRDGQVQDRAHEARLHHRRDGGARVHPRAHIELGGSRRLVAA